MEYKEIKPSELRVGDVFAALFTNEFSGITRLYTDVVATAVRADEVLAEGLNFRTDCITFFRTDCNTFYLIERPKKPLPTAIGSVVEVDGVKYVRVLKDSEWYYEWVKVENTDHFETITTEELAEYDFTVV